MTTFRSPDEQQRVFDAHAARLAYCTNVGETGDQRDLYAVVDSLIGEVRAMNPPFACKAGCNQCCYLTPLVTSLEWRAMYRQLLRLPEDVRRRIVDMAETLRPVAAYFKDKLATTLKPGRPSDLTGQLAIQCPFLVDGLCSVYEQRPLACRGFGFTMTKGQGQAILFGSQLARAHIVVRFKHPLKLPLFETYAAKVRELHGSKGFQGFLPQWLWAHMSDGDVSRQLNPHPDFFQAGTASP